MAVRIGIPQALLYFDFYPLWKTFFEGLGAEVVTSGCTDKEMLKNGIKLSASDLCLPVKVFHGHVASLIGKVDYLFLPRIKSVAKKEFICPKFTGLPELLRFSQMELPPVIDTEICLLKSERNLQRAFFHAGSFLTGDKKRIMRAAEEAMGAYRRYITALRGGLTTFELLSGKRINRGKGMKVALLGHPYTVYDAFTGMNLFEKLCAKGIEVVTPEMLSQEDIDCVAQTFSKPMYWTIGKRQLAAAELMPDVGADGIIYLSAFGCGVDSFITELCRKKSEQTGLPFMLITVDEHSGSAGTDTRLEAFIDMLTWRKQNENGISAHR